MKPNPSTQDGPPDRPPPWGIGFAALTMLLLGLLLARAWVSAARADALTQATRDAAASLQQVQMRYLLASSSLRLYVATHYEPHKVDYQQSREALRPLVDHLHELSRSAPPLVDPVDGEALAGQLSRRDQQLQAAFAAFQAEGLAGVRGVTERLGTDEADHLAKDLLARALSSQEALLSDRARRGSDLRGELLRAIGLFAVASALILGVILNFARRNVLRRRAAEAEADAQRRLAQLIVDNVPLGVYMKDARDLRVVLANPEALTISGRTREEILGKQELDLFPVEYPRLRMAAEREQIDQQAMKRVEDVHVEGPAGPRMLHIRKVLVQDAAGEIRHLLCIAEDVTERLRAERELREYAVTLQTQGRELQAANQELATMNRDLDSFTFSVTHDLKAPLRAVAGYAAFLQEDFGAGLAVEARNMLQGIRDGTARMSRLIDDLLSFSRLGRRPMTRTVFDTRRLILETWERLLAGQPDTRATLQLGDLPASFGDESLLTQVWTNLLDNAAKYSRQAAEPLVRVEGWRHGDRLLFTVRDNGVGFDPRETDKLFIPFQRLHDDTQFPGTGVGLAIVRRIIERHGGQIEAQAEPGRGACFQFTLALG